MVDPHVKLAVFDFDGVFTNGQIHFDHKLNASVTINVKDTYALKLLKDRGVKIGVLSANRCCFIREIYLIKEKVDFFITECLDKKAEMKRLMEEYKVSSRETSYMGDDIPDLEALGMVKWSACPCDAVDECRKESWYVCEKPGGNQAVREYVNYLIKIEHV